jgi:hypothetical protein
MSLARVHRQEATHELDCRSDSCRGERTQKTARWSLRKRTVMIATAFSAAVASFVHAQIPTPTSVGVGPWRTGVAVTCPGGRVIPANTAISGPNVTAEQLCGTGSASSSSSASGTVVPNTGNLVQDTLTKGVNTMIANNMKNALVSNFMQGAATSFISSMFASDDGEAQRQQQAMAEEILRRQQEQELQMRIAQQQRLDAMFARLNQALKLEGVPFGLSLKPMNTAGDLQLKGLSSSGPDDLKLKMGSHGGYGIQWLPGIYVGGPAGSQTADSSNSAGNDSKGYGIQGLPGVYVGGPAGGQAGDTSANSGGIPGLPGVNLNGVQPSQAPALAQAAQILNGPDRALAEDTALQAAQQNPALTAASQDPRVENFQQANQDYQQALQANASASSNFQTAQEHVEADQSAIAVAQKQIQAVTPTVQQQQAFNQMLAAAKTDEDASVAARKIFENADAHLSVTRTQAAGALANLTAPSGSPTTSTTVDLKGATQMQPALLRPAAATGGPVSPAPARPSAPTPPATVASRSSLSSTDDPADVLSVCLAAAGRVTQGAPASPEELRNQLDGAKEALRRLIEDHEKEDALRDQWDEEVNDAVHDAKKQAVDLSVDYLLHKAQAVTRAKIWKADAEVQELQRLAGTDPSKMTSLGAQIEQTSARSQNLQHTLQSLKDLQDGVETQERLRDLREWGQSDPQELQQAAGYLEGVKQLVQTALAEDSVKAALHYTPYVDDAIKWGSSLIDTSYDLTAEYLGSRQLDQLNRNSDQYLQAVNILNKRIRASVSQLNCYKRDSAPDPRSLQVTAGGTR